MTEWTRAEEQRYSRKRKEIDELFNTLSSEVQQTLDVFLQGAYTEVRTPLNSSRGKIITDLVDEMSRLPPPPVMHSVGVSTEQDKPTTTKNQQQPQAAKRSPSRSPSPAPRVSPRKKRKTMVTAEDNPEPEPPHAPRLKVRNKAVQLGTIQDTRHPKHNKLGLFAQRKFAVGDELGIYAGVTRTVEEAVEMEDQCEPQYLVVLPARPGREELHVIDGTSETNELAFVNDSRCTRGKPNIRLNDTPKFCPETGFPIIVMEATAKIAPGDEILVDYGAELEVGKAARKPVPKQVKYRKAPFPSGKQFRSFPLWQAGPAATNWISTESMHTTLQSTRMEKVKIGQRGQDFVAMPIALIAEGTLLGNVGGTVCDNRKSKTTNPGRVIQCDCDGSECATLGAVQPTNEVRWFDDVSTKQANCKLVYTHSTWGYPLLQVYTRKPVTKAEVLSLNFHAPF
eukprot:TRINITY_DN63085_c0_g2_i1.p1 TRINITY_DN63085_c0_g2~~TRINITY_DN63085_c0_g2_i1.p1  ORF type:complete len:453 (+),score=43.79 TRINITY_DN63085_c0_g2_i1:13-1371(+)